MTTTRAWRALGVLATTIAASGAFAAQAGAHARVFPSTVVKGEGSAYSLVVPNESEEASITEVSITVPEGFLIGGFEAAPGWKRTAEASGEGHDAITSKVTWTGGDVPTGEAAWFRFTGRPDEEHGADLTEYKFEVSQTYSDGEVADWSGPEDSDSPAPVVALVDSLGGGDGDTTVAVESDEDDGGDGMGTIALIVAILALLLGIGGLVRRGGRSLT